MREGSRGEGEGEMWRLKEEGGPDREMERRALFPREGRSA